MLELVQERKHGPVYRLRSLARRHHHQKIGSSPCVGVPPPGTVGLMAGGDDDVGVLGSVLDRVERDDNLGREAVEALRRACELLGRVALSGEPGAGELVRYRLPLLAAAVDRAAAIRRKRDQRRPARLVAREIEAAIRRWAASNAGARAADDKRWFYPCVWDAIRRAWDLVDAEFEASRVPKRRRSMTTFREIRAGSRSRFRNVVEYEARAFQSDPPHHVVVGGDVPREQLVEAGRRDIEDILLALYFPSRQANSAAGFRDEDLVRRSAVVNQIDDGDSGFGPVAATHVLLAQIVDKSARTVEKAELSAARREVLPPLGGGESGTPLDPCLVVEQRRVGSLRDGGSARRRLRGD